MIKQKWVYDVQASALLCLLVGTSRRFQVGLVFNKAPREEQTKFRLGNKSIIVFKAQSSTFYQEIHP